MHSHAHGQCRHAQNQRIQTGCRLPIGRGPTAAGDAGMSTQSGMLLNGFIDPHKFVAWNFEQPTAAVFSTVFDASTPTPPEAAVNSDCDEELLMYLPFTEFMRIRGVAILGGGSGTGPSHVSLFANQNEMHGFDTVQRLQPDERLELVDTSDDDELIYLLDAPKFMSVGNLTIFVSRGFDEDCTKLRKILLFGESTKLPTVRPMATNVVYELRGNPADHPEQEEEKKFNNLVK
uniref:PITH domain-containing protein n=1 Tax=Neobodo designis TaxID=312471 RepID=A0A7S1M1H5_NEODS|mmetsp:Transcript_32398/g.100213  ORF Transcript_32398/g.100213 Transcript_32398/m.100213 type:complete len:233 (+) Transcript_32398:149-847(+)|eukprot:CAMPEP_0174849910 /NCGR_PEP_ID=MMETSP1114-20130205/18143_1 /TAXON_ID=312471 /ORGANISM="Neobodo designis, Strain CCAP 1951/1" /LENGTH=232 /DNA_ID=CAMNT_0016084325 /DNA_START=149 /DNA_END=847 /DNA_ORIENTATION=+